MVGELCCTARLECADVASSRNIYTSFCVPLANALKGVPRLRFSWGEFSIKIYMCIHIDASESPRGVFMTISYLLGEPGELISVHIY